MSKAPLRIRDIRPKDFETIYRIDHVCFPPDIAFSRAELAFYLSYPKSIARVAEGVDGIAGFILATIEDHSSAHVLTLDVMPEMRQCKIGTKLMNDLHHALDKQGIGISILEVEVKNVVAQRLYEKLGYESQGLLIGYYHGREDAYRMKRNRSRIPAFRLSSCER